MKVKRGVDNTKQRLKQTATMLEQLAAACYTVKKVRNFSVSRRDVTYQ
jgi:hypothetical protein